MTFSTQYEARVFLIGKIAEQAGRTSSALSDDERRMLHLNLDDPGSADGIPAEILEDKNKKFEKKASRLLRAAYDRDRASMEERQNYREALRTLSDNRFYLLIIADDAISQRRRIGDYALYVLIALAMIAMIAGLQFWTHHQ